MTSTTTTTTASSAAPSIYIHRAHSECCDPDIFKTTFEKALGNDGCVRSIDLVKKTDQNGIPFVRAFIHFKFWPEGDVADRMRRELMTDQRLTITYNHETNWFWRFCRSKLPARDDKTAPRTKRKPRKNHYGSPPAPTTDAVQSAAPVVSKSNSGYKETSKRKVSNKPSWMSVTGNVPSVSTLADFVDAASKSTSDSDDNESFEDYPIITKTEDGEVDGHDAILIEPPSSPPRMEAQGM